MMPIGGWMGGGRWGAGEVGLGLPPPPWRAPCLDGAGLQGSPNLDSQGPSEPTHKPSSLSVLPTLSLPHSGSTARASRVAAHSAQPTLAKSSERSSLTSRPEGLVAGASPSILDWRGWAGGPGERTLG